MEEHEILHQILAEVKGLKTDVGDLKNDVASLKTDVSSLKTDMADVKGQLDENTGFIKALVHQTEELDAKFDGLLSTTATKEAVQRIEGKMATKKGLSALAEDVNFMVRKIIDHDDAIRLLQKAE